MCIFAIDSTSAVARVSLTENNLVIKEIVSPHVHWDAMVSGNTDELMEDFMNIIHIFFDDLDKSWDDVDHICYSGQSGFKVSMQLGKMLSKFYGLAYGKTVENVDHITAHYFSLFVGQEKKQVFPKLIYSASGSHNSIAYMKNWNDVVILNDTTYFDKKEGKHIGLGSIYNRLLRSLDILREDQSPQEIPGVLNALNAQVDNELVSTFKKIYINQNIFNLDLYDYFATCQSKLLDLKGTYNVGVIFLSFQQSMFEILAEKFEALQTILPFQEIAVVGGISQNDDFLDFLSKKYSKNPCNIARPLDKYRFDNAAMLGVLSYYSKKYETKYPISKIIT